MSRKDKEKAIRRSSILDAAEEIFARRGFFSTTMEDVAKRSEFGMSTLYKFFESKHSLYFSIIDEKLSRLQELLGHVTESDLPWESAIHDFVARYLQFFQENRHFLKIYMTEKLALAHEAKEEFWRKTKVRVQDYVESAENALREWIEEGHIGTSDAQARALAILSTVEAYLSRGLADEDGECSRDRASSIVRMFLTSASPETPGSKG